MARLPRFIQADVPVHHVLRGNNRSPIFVDDLDRQLYRDLLIDGCRRFDCQVHAYVLMSNHTHLLLTPGAPPGISRLTQWMGQRYVRAFNKRHGRTGTLWEGRFWSTAISTQRYFITCSRYIDQNPVRAGIVREPSAFPWSSHARLGYGVTDPLIVEHAEYQALGATATQRQQVYRDLCAPLLDPLMAEGIRRLTKRGMALTADALAEHCEL